MPAIEVYCGHCGLPRDAGSHAPCDARLALEPPRYCTECRRRMVVQVIPGEWTAQCVEHGEITASTWSGGD